MADDRQRHRRVAATVALVAGAAALVIAVGFAVDNLLTLLAALVGAGIGVTGGWVAAAGRGARRVLALVVACLGVVLAVVGILAAGGRSLLGLVGAGALGALSVAAARYATGRRADSVTAADLAKPRGPARHPVLIMNPVSGGGKVEELDLEQECRSRGIEPIVLQPGDDLTGLAEDAIARGADAIGMAGGDGSQALVADVARSHRIPMVVVPAGTRNHLALDLGLDRDDVVGALDAFRAGVPRRVDLARVNGRIFVNNASLGLYAEIVSSEAYRDAKLRTTLEALPDLLGPDAQGLDIHYPGPDGRPVEPGQVLLVSNNPYSWETLGGVGTRARLDTGELGIVSVSLTSATQARRFLALETAGQISRYPGWLSWTAARFEVTSSTALAIALDGEALTMDPPLAFEILPGALTVLLPPHAPGRSPAARTLSLSTPVELWELARGSR